MTAARFWLAAGAIIVLRLALVADLSLQPLEAPADDGLYVSRAYHLLRGEGLGPYDGWLLAKHPGLSLWMAGVRLLGIPYLLSVQLLYLLAGLYFVWIFVRAGYGRGRLLALFAVHAFNPITLDDVWFHVLREPLSVGLSVLIFASMCAILIELSHERAAPLALGLLAGAFALAVLVREEDRLLYVAVVLFDAVVTWHAWRGGGARQWRRAAVMAALPLAVGVSAEAATRSFVARHYGQPILNDLHEGEFPGLIAAMRSVDVGKHDRLVMIPQEAFGRLRATVASTAPLIDKLPPPGPESESCRVFRVCDEWTNGFVIFWVKDAAFRAGLTPDLVAAQAYFGATARGIRAACERGSLRCRPDGDGLLPRFDLRWTSALLGEGRIVFASMLGPGIMLPVKRTEATSAELRRMFRTVTLEKTRPAPWAKPPWVAQALKFGRRTAVTAGVFGILVMLPVGSLVLAGRFAAWRREPVSPVVVVGAIAFALAAARLAVLSYAAVYVGILHPRFVYSTYAVAVLISGVVLVETIDVVRRRRGRAPAATAPPASATIRA